MKKHFILITALSVILFLFGCSEEKENSGTNTKVTTTQEQSHSETISTNNTNTETITFEDKNEQFYFNGITPGMTMEEVINEIGEIPYHEELDESGNSDIVHVYEDLGLHIGYNANFVQSIYLTISRDDFDSIIESNIYAQKYQTSYDSDHYFYFHSSPKQLLKVGDYSSKPELDVYVLVPDSNFTISDWIPVN